jgi:hypothetical protein
MEKQKKRKILSSFLEKGTSLDVLTIQFNTNPTDGTHCHTST